MPRFSLTKSLFTLALGLCLIGSGAAASLAQGDEATTEDGTPPSGQETPATGWLQLSAVSCSTGGDPGTISILLAQEYAPPGECTDGSTPLLIDGVDYGPVAPYLELQVAAGFHNLYEPNSGASRDVEVLADGATQVVVVGFTAPAEEPTVEPTVEPAAEAVTTGLTVVAHSCKPDVQTADQLWALGNLTARLNACPAMTLSGYPSPAGTANGGEQYLDFTLSPATGDAQTLTGQGAFVSDAFCESTVGALDNDPTNDRCVSNSGFSFQLAEGPATLTLTSVPDLMRYVAAETGSDADASIITGSDPSSWYLGLDTSLRGTDQPVVHLFFLNPPEVNLVMHLCGNDVTSSADLEGLGSQAAQLLSCPAVARTNEGGSADFGMTVADNNWGARDLNGAVFEYATTCESDIGDWNGNGGDNACVDAPTYRFEQTAQGYVGITQDVLPDGYVFGGATGQDAGVISAIDLASGAVSLDTSYDGDVTVHLFGIPEAAPETATSTATSTSSRTAVPATATSTRTSIPPSATVTSAGPTQTPTRTATSPAATSTPTETTIPPSATATTETSGETGTVTIVALYCLTSSGTSVVALAPGASASASDLGGSSCFAGDASIAISYANGGSAPAFKLGRDGVESIQNVPATAGGLHTLSEQLTGQSTTFAVAPGTVTRVIVKYGAGTAMVDEGVTSSSGGSNASGTSTAGSSASGGLVTDELIGDDGSISTASFANVSFTSLVVEDVDAQAVSSITDAKSLPGVGTGQGFSMDRYLTLLAAMGAACLGMGIVTRRTKRGAVL